MKQVERIVGARGQVTIPKAIREALKLETGSTVEVVLDGNKIIIKKKK